MEKYFSAMQQNPLFKDIEASSFSKMLNCMQAKEQSYSKGQIILLAGSPVENIGIVIDGSVQITKADINGGQTIIALLLSGQMFLEVFACARVQRSPVTVIAAESTSVLHLNYSRAITACTALCPFHKQLIENMLLLLAEKNLFLNQKLEIISKRTTRQRLLLFLQQYGSGAKQITIPFNREELAQYLCVERSALCAEISKMQTDKIIKCSRRSFTLL